LTFILRWNYFKTIERANPSIVVLEKGTIKQKVHYNDKKIGTINSHKGNIIIRTNFTNMTIRSRLKKEMLKYS
jgi:hypothetical protein